MMAALPNTGGGRSALCSMSQSLADAHYTRVACSNAPKTRKPLKFAGVPQTPEPISAASGPKFAILWVYVEDILLLNKFAKIQPNKVVRWCPDGDFLRRFCVLYFQRAACSTFQSFILNSH